MEGTPYDESEPPDILPISSPEHWANLNILLINYTTARLVGEEASLSIAFLQLSSEQLSTLYALTPDINNETVTLKAAFSIFSKSRDAQRVRAVTQRNRVRAALNLKDELFQRGLIRFSGGVPVDGDEADKLLCWDNYLKALAQTAQCLIKKVSYALKIAQSFQKISDFVVQFPVKKNNLILGLADKQECFSLGRNVNSEFQNLSQLIEDYFSVPIPITNNRRMQELLRASISEHCVVENLSLQLFLDYNATNSLHLHSDFSEDVAPMNWGGMTEIQTKLSSFLETLVNFQPDEYSTILSKIQKRRELALKIIEESKSIVLEDSVSDLFKLKLLRQELSELHKDYLCWSTTIPWTTENFGVGREDFSNVKTNIEKKIQQKELLEKEINREKEDISKSLAKGRPLPKITPKTWSRFMRLYSLESKKLSTDQGRIALLKNSLVDRSDIMANETVTNLSTILEYLFTRYGRPENIATQALEELQSKKPPSQNLEDHLIDIKNLFSYIIYENQQHLVTNEVSLKISQGIFPEAERKDFVKRLIEHKNEAQKIFLPSSTYEHFSDFYNKTKGLERVNLFVEFINDTLEFRRALAVGKKGTIQKQLKTMGQKWSCPLCKTGHINAKGAIRPYLAVCEIFLNMNQNDRYQTVKKLNYCVVCLSSSVPQGKNCNKINILNCKCTAAVKSPHNQLLCKTMSSSKTNDSFFKKHNDSDDKNNSVRKSKSKYLQLLPPQTNSSCSDISSCNYKVTKYQNSTTFQKWFGFNIPLLLLSISTSFVLDPDMLCKQSFKRMLQANWLDVGLVLHSVFLATTILNKTKISFLTLSDTGASLSFITSSLVKKLNLIKIGMWEGTIAGINQEKQISTPVYKISLNLICGNTKTLFVLEIPRIGFHRGLPAEAVPLLCAHFGVDPRDVFTQSGTIELLLGLDNNNILLSKVTHVNDKPVFPPPWSKQTYLNFSTASDLFCFTGLLGKQSRPAVNFNFKCSGVFIFYTELMSQQTRKLIQELDIPYDERQDILSITSTQVFPKTLSPILDASTPMDEIKLSAQQWSDIYANAEKISKKKIAPMIPKYSNFMEKFLLPVTICTLLAPSPTSAFLPLREAQLTQLRTFVEGPKSSDCKSANEFDRLNHDYDQNLPDLDTLSRLRLCDECKHRQKSCESCHIHNSPITKENLRQLEIMKKLIWVEKVSDLTMSCISLFQFQPIFIIKVSYPLTVDISAYSPEKTNYESALKASIRLKTKLKKLKLMKEFHSEMIKSIELGHLTKLSNEQKKKVMSRPHNFTYLNYVQKLNKNIRPVSNSSCPHKSGSLNSNCLSGPNLLSNLYQIIMGIVLSPFMCILDIKQAFRSIFTCETSNSLRLLCYWSDPDDETCDQVLQLKRLNYGDACSSCFLELCLRLIVLPACETQLAKDTISKFRFVDDFMILSLSHQELEEAVFDLVKTLNSFSIPVKHSIFSHKLLPPVIDPIQVVFHHEYDVIKDFFTICTDINLHKKTRGTFTGKYLSEMSQVEIAQQKIGKTHIARILGTLFDPLGQLAVVRACFLSYFSDICEIIKDWKTCLQNHDPLRLKIINSLIDLSKSIPVVPFPRCKIHMNEKLIQLVAFSDASLKLIAVTLYVITSTGDQNNSKFLASTCLARSASIPAMELLAHVLAVDKIFELFKHHHKFLFRNTNQLVTVSYRMDSVCCLHQLNPFSISKSIIVRNAKTKTLAVSKWLTENFNVLVSYSHCPSQQNCADLATKITDRPFSEIINGPLWRKGHVSGLLSSALDEDIFITVEKGEIKWLKEQVSNCSCQLSDHCDSELYLENTLYDLTSDIPFDYNYDHTCEDGQITGKTVHQLLTINKDIPVFQEFQSTVHDFHLLPVLPSTPEIMCLGVLNPERYCEEDFCLPGSSLHDSQEQEVLTSDYTAPTTHATKIMKETLGALPLLSHRYVNMLKKYTRSLSSVLRSVALTILPYVTFYHLEIFHNYVDKEDSLSIKVPKKNFRLQSQNMCKEILYFAYLALHQYSNYYFPPQTPLPLIKLNNSFFVLTRYSIQLMIIIFRNPFLCIISSNDEFLSTLLFEAAHLYYEESTSFIQRYSFHLNHEVTHVRLATNKIAATIIPNMKDFIHKKILDCVHCRWKDAHLGKLRTYTFPKAGSPLHTVGLNDISEVGPFRSISIDIVTIKLRTWPGMKRAGPPAEVLFYVCLDTGFVGHIVMESTSLPCVVSALTLIFIKYNSPKIIFSDHYSTFKSIKNQNLFPHIQWILAPPSSQFINYVENSLRAMKKLLGKLSKMNLTNVQLQTRLDIATAILNIRPVKKTNLNPMAKSISPRELFLPILGHAELLASWDCAEQKLNDSTCWDKYGKMGSINQRILQELILETLVAENSFKYSLSQGDNNPRHNANNEETIEAKEGDLVILKHEELKIARIAKITKYPSDVTILVKTNNITTRRPSHLRRLGFLCRGPKVIQ